VSGQALVTVVGGLAAGAVVAALAAQRLESFLFQVTVLDPLPVLAVAATVVFLAWRAAAGPARVAARQDPMQALRSD
jgi:hypothetical protein